MGEKDGVIKELLHLAREAELRSFVEQMAARDQAFAVKLSQWLMSMYGAYAHRGSVFVDEVNSLFGMTEEKYRGYNRWRYYDDCGLNWSAIDSGMQSIVAALGENLEAGNHAVVVPPVVAFYRELARHCDEFMEEEEVSINDAARACDELLLKWAGHPDVPLQEKQEVVETLRRLADSEIMDYVDGLSDDFFDDYNIRMKDPDDAILYIEKRVEEGGVSETLVQRHVALLRQVGRTAEALEIVRRNLRYRSVLDAELNRLYDMNYDAAALNLLDLANTGNQQKTELEERKIRFLIRLGETRRLMEIYRFLMLNSWNGFDYYLRLKALVPVAEWPERYSAIVAEAKAARCSSGLMARIYAEERDAPALYQIVLSTKYDFLSVLHEYLPQLPEEYHGVLLKKGCDVIEREAHVAKKRSDYARVVATIRRFATLPGAGPLADNLVAMLRDTYARRPAFIDELSTL